MLTFINHYARGQVMVDKKVKRWVKDQQALGYSLEEIHTFLIEQGYPPDVADEATGTVPEDSGLEKLKAFGKSKFLENRKALPLLIAGAIILSLIVGIVISSLSKRGPETPAESPEVPKILDVPDDSGETDLEDTPPDGGIGFPPDEGSELAPEDEDPNECDAIGENAACDDGNSSTYDHCFDNTTSGLRQCAHIYEPIGNFDLDKALGLAIDASDLIDFCAKENISTAEAYLDWTPGQVRIYNNEPPKACTVYVTRWCKGWLVECVVNQTRKIEPVYAMKIPFEDSYVVSKQQIVELPVEVESVE